MDLFKNFQPLPTSPINNGFSITPNDSSDLQNVTRAIYIGTTGNIRVTLKGGSTITFNNMPVGIFPLRISKVHSTNTTASDIVGLF